jgi:hypothetical protein
VALEVAVDQHDRHGGMSSPVQRQLAARVRAQPIRNRPAQSVVERITVPRQDDGSPEHPRERSRRLAARSRSLSGKHPRRVS